MNLYKIEAEIMNCMEEVDEETGELLNAGRLDALVMERERKIENIACWIKNLKAESEALQKEKKAFEKRQRAVANKADQLKKYLENVLHGQKFITDKVVVSWRRSQQVVVEDWQQVDESYLKYKEPDVDKVGVRQALKDGVELKGVLLVEKNNIQIK